MVSPRFHGHFIESDNSIRANQCNIVENLCVPWGYGLHVLPAGFSTSNTLPLKTTNPYLAQVIILLLSGYSHRKGYRMRNIIVATLFFLLSSNAFACYDESLSDRTNFNNCLVEAKQGDAYAQYNLGVMYDNGKGVAQDQDYKEAVKW